MNSFRPLLALTLVCSLVASDMLTFWHLGDCRCKVSATADAAERGPHAAHAGGCTQHGNPFAKRRAERVANETQTTPLASCCRDHECPQEHEPEDCSLCRWLAMARDPLVMRTAVVRVELACIPVSVLRQWAQPSLEPLLQDLLRRGPPRSFSLS